MKFLKYITKHDQSLLDFFFIYNAIQLGNMISNNLFLQIISSFAIAMPLIILSSYLKGIADASKD